MLGMASHQAIPGLDDWSNNWPEVANELRVHNVADVEGR
jgi:hypothetical protein